MLDVPLLFELELVLALGLVVDEPLAPMLEVLGVVLELDVLAFAPPCPPAEADEPVPAAAPEEPLDWATATPPIVRAAAAASVVRIFFDMSRLLEMHTRERVRLIGKAGALPTSESLNFERSRKSGPTQAQPVGPALSQVDAQDRSCDCWAMGSAPHASICNAGYAHSQPMAKSSSSTGADASRTASGTRRGVEDCADEFEAFMTRPFRDASGLIASSAARKHSHIRQMPEPA
jgi:hypothetical protein